MIKHHYKWSITRDDTLGAGLFLEPWTKIREAIAILFLDGGDIISEFFWILFNRFIRFFPDGTNLFDNFVFPIPPPFCVFFRILHYFLVGSRNNRNRSFEKFRNNVAYSGFPAKNARYLSTASFTAFSPAFPSDEKSSVSTCTPFPVTVLRQVPRTNPSTTTI